MNANISSPEGTQVRTADQVRADFDRRGLTIATWARANGFRAKAVQQVLSRPTAGRFGVAHRIAVALGLKNGVVEPQDAA